MYSVRGNRAVFDCGVLDDNPFGLPDNPSVAIPMSVGVISPLPPEKSDLPNVRARACVCACACVCAYVGYWVEYTSN